jgi:hypothetical protein
MPAINQPSLGGGVQPVQAPAGGGNEMFNLGQFLARMRSQRPVTTAPVAGVSPAMLAKPARMTEDEHRQALYAHEDGQPFDYQAYAAENL